MLYGSWPQAYDEVVLVLDENNSIPVQTLYQLGLITADQYRQAEDEIAEDGQASELRLDYACLLYTSNHKLHNFFLHFVFLLSIFYLDVFGEI